MENILYTKSDDLTIKTCFIADSEEFATIIEYPDGSQTVAETFKSVMYMIEIHDFWCKFTGVTKDKISSDLVKAHLLPA